MLQQLRASKLSVQRVVQLVDWNATIVSISTSDFGIVCSIHEFAAIARTRIALQTPFGGQATEATVTRAGKTTNEPRPRLAIAPMQLR
jgi:NADH:ubiquinone oxidoreductase subunit B-like Fe-S oxidoreductase